MAPIFNICRSITRPALILVGLAACVSTAVGQQRAKTMAGVIKDRQELRTATTAAREALRGSLNNAKQNALRKYYAHIIAGMTTPQGAANLPKFRSSLKNATTRAGSAATQKYLTDLFYSGLKTIANPTKGFSLAARYNAVPALGDLNSREEKSGEKFVGDRRRMAVVCIYTEHRRMHSTAS